MKLVRGREVVVAIFCAGWALTGVSVALGQSTAWLACTSEMLRCIRSRSCRELSGLEAQDACKKPCIDQRRTCEANVSEQENPTAGEPSAGCRDRTDCLSVQARTVKDGICGDGGTVTADLRNRCSEPIECSICVVDSSGQRLAGGCNEYSLPGGATKSGVYETSYWCSNPVTARLRHRCAMKGDSYACHRQP